MRKIVNSLKKQKSVVAVYLFGSAARGKTTPMSDIDLAVFLHPYDREAALQIGSYSSPHVDTMVFNDAPPYMKFEIIRDGKPLFIRDKEAVRGMAAAALREYHEYVPFYERQGLLKVAT